MASYLLTKEVAKAVTEDVLRCFHLLVNTGEGIKPKRPALAVVVLDPTVSYAPGIPLKDAILYVGRFGAHDWEGKYDLIAKLKAEVSWKTGLPSHLVQQRAPYLYVFDDVKYGGSAVLEGGLVVAASGVEPYFDEMFAYWVATACRAYSIGQMRRIMEDPGDRLNGNEII